MTLDWRARSLSAGLAFGALVALGTMLSGGAAASQEAPSAQAAAKCKKANNVEAIIDDSGSMSFEDPNKFRTKLLETFAGIGANSGRTLGGGEFGNGYAALFGPGKIPGINGAMTASFGLVNADNGGTNYQAAFAGANAHNPNAQARIFLSDGAPNPGTYPTAHVSPRTKTYVVGLGTFAADPAGNATLSQLAAETGGPPPFLVSDASQVQPVAGTITAALECKRVQTFTDVFKRQGKSKSHKSKARGKSMDILTTWGALNTALKLSASVAGKKKAGKSLASASKVKVTRKRGSNFASLRIKGLRKGQRVKIKIKAKRLPLPGTVATTQVIK